MIYALSRLQIRRRAEPNKKERGESRKDCIPFTEKAEILQYLEDTEKTQMKYYRIKTLGEKGSGGGGLNWL